MRINEQEKMALKSALENFKGKVFLFGSRVDAQKKGGDIDLLLVPSEKINKIKLAIEIEAKFFSQLEQKLDVIIYDEKNIFVKEVMKNARQIDFKAI